MIRIAAIIVGVVMATSPAVAQSGTDGPVTSVKAPVPLDPGRPATSSVGEVGQRQTRYQMQGISPVARLANRIDNRIQSRIQNRIDRDYQADASGTSAFATAEKRTRSTAQRR